jgi:hypothetical protein
METIFSENVSDLPLSKKESLEAVLGRHLEENQRVIIRVLEGGTEPDEAARRQAMMRAAQIAKEGRAAAEAQGVTTARADTAIDDAVRQLRQSSR